MKYFVSTGSDLEAYDAHPEIGIMTGPRCWGIVNVQAGRVWASDCDALSKHGYDEAAYFRHLERMAKFASTCAFVVVPDVPGSGEETLTVYLQDAPTIALFGFPLAYVLQDGAENFDLPPCDVAFLGGTDAWRLKWGATLLQRAREEGLGTHVGRVNSDVRMSALRFTAADSVDGTYLSFLGVERGLKTIGRWLDSANAPSLFEAADFKPVLTAL
ncbi:hypothetical protein [Deinococcus ruber]|uniref:Uncharacterized protein n=1 Tax=Deinococcus ruber TaxID=1848197 RepID=A0A918CCE2_9DEIO|nr:hypothetical protein [Deinococcus ruber]GGR17144.1 hypothetical protein GCM10008957_32180 [Deinococcus ruber]